MSNVMMVVKFVNNLFIFIFIFSLKAYPIKPDRKYNYLPSDFNMDYEEYKLITPDSVKLNVWDIKANKDKNKNTTVIVCIGDAGNMSYYLEPAHLLSENGFNVILFDYRGFGKSDDFKMDLNFLFYSEFLIDYETVFSATKLHHKNKIGVLAFSMGGYFPMESNLTPDFIILDSPMLNPISIINRLKKDNIISPTINKNIPCKQIPMIIFWGNEDKITMQVDFEACSDNQFSISYKGNHMQLFKKIPKYQIIQFIKIITDIPYENK